MWDILARTRRSSFVKNILIVMSGTATAQVIGFALTPIISRLYSPTDFGIFGSFNAVFGVIAAGITLEYSQAMMLPKEKGEAVNLFMVSCLSTILITVCCASVCLLFPNFIQGLMKVKNNWILTSLVFAVLVSGLNQACQAWCVRVKAFKDTSASQVVRSISSNGSQVALGYLRGGPLGLVCSSILGDLLASLNLVRVVFRDLGALRREVRWKRIVHVSKDYRDFPLYAGSMNVVNALSQGLPVLLLTHFYGIGVAGLYAFGVRILSVPMGFVLRSLRQVLFQKASETYNHGNRLVPLYFKVTGALIAMALFPSLVLVLWAPQIFAWIFGSQWYTAGEFARWLVLWLMFMFSNVPAVIFGRIIRIQRKIFVIDVVLLAGRTLVLVIGGTYMPASYTILLFSVVGAIINIIFILLVGYFLIRKERDIA